MTSDYTTVVCHLCILSLFYNHLRTKNISEKCYLQHFGGLQVNKMCGNLLFLNLANFSLLQPQPAFPLEKTYDKSENIVSV